MNPRFTRLAALVVWALGYVLMRLAACESAFAVGPEPVGLEVFPSRVVLDSGRDSQGLVAIARYADGSARDVTADAKVAIADEGVVVYENETLVPGAIGETRVTVEWRSRTVDVEVKVNSVNDSQEIGFRREVVPVLTKAGCNSGKCHGAASGKDGFRLSLFGYDAEGDRSRLVDELRGRRINLADPEASLLIHKAIGEVPHTGGGRIARGDEGYDLLVAWIGNGAKPDAPDAVVPTGIRVYPGESVISSPGQLQKLVVLATYSDGSDRDVTRWTTFVSNNPSVAEVNDEGMISSTGTGDAFVLARFDQFVEGSGVIVRPSADGSVPFIFPELDEANYIDRHVHERLKRMHLFPSELADDDTFLRRVSIDLTGSLPTPALRESLMADPSPQKREALIRSLIETPQFRDLWALHWADLLQVRSNNGMSGKALSLYDEWLRRRVHEGRTIDQIVREVIPATGGTFDNPPTNYFQTETSPLLLAEGIAQVFLGTRIQCAQCHNHPFDRWTMDDYYGFASFFGQIKYKQAADPRELTIFNSPGDSLVHPVAGRQVTPRFLGESTPVFEPAEDYRQRLAQWLADRRNVAFARNIANIVWAHFMGTGIVEPIDDFRVSNPPSNPELLDALAEKLVGYGFDVSRLAEDICRSRAYQLSSRTNSSNALDRRNFSHAKVRRMRAEVLLDCISQVTEVAEKYPGLPEGRRAIEIADGATPNYFLTTFGRATRQTPCSCEVKTNPTLSQAMHLLNGETTNEKIKAGGVIRRLLQQHQDPRIVADQLYLRCYSRHPDDSEREQIATRLKGYDNPESGLEDLFWAILNSNEFILNH